MGVIDEEQAFLDDAYVVLARHTDALEHRMTRLRSAPSTGTGQDDIERQAQFDNLLHQWRSAQAAQERLCFGRVDMADGGRFHIGRIGLRDDGGDPVLLDWRAPQAAGFYQATTVDPHGVARRRRIITRGRTVTHVEDDDLADPTATSTDGAVAAMQTPRDGRMGDIIATIAADQDAIIRSPLSQVTVVEGGPGTGKTVVALHRAAWLLYTHRDRLAKDGVLVIGPSPAFLQYIEQVLPSLGETDVVLLTPAQLVPGVTATATDEPAVAAIKGDLRMATVVARAVRNRQRVPHHDVRIELEDGSSLTLTARALDDARRAVPRNGTFHDGREPFLRKALDALARDRCRQRGDDPSDPDHRQQAIDDLIDDRHVRRTLNLMWLPITAERLLRLLLSDEATLRSAARDVLTDDEIRSLLRPADAPWTTDDIPLLDEAAALLGDLPVPRTREVGVDVEELSARDPFASSRPTSTLAERAIADREWVYGHVIVDEAQELSAMAWHCVARRSTRRSMTIVGDLQQATHPAAARDWDEALREISATTVRHTLTITYRITRQTAGTAIEQLVAAGGTAPDLHPIRDGSPTEFLRCTTTELRDVIIALCTDRPGRACVVLPDEDLTRLGPRLDSAAFGFGSAALDAPIAVLSARDTKGLEFDTVVVVRPDAVARQATRGSDIYVACTRATSTLVLVDLIAD